MHSISKSTIMTQDMFKGRGQSCHSNQQNGHRHQNVYDEINEGHLQLELDIYVIAVPRSHNIEEYQGCL